MPINRRGFLAGLAALVAAPAIVRVDNIMAVKTVLWTPREYWVVPSLLQHGDGSENNPFSSIEEAYRVVNRLLPAESFAKIHISHWTVNHQVVKPNVLIPRTVEANPWANRLLSLADTPKREPLILN